MSVLDETHPSDERISKALAAILRRALTVEGIDDEKLEGDTGVNRHTIKAYRLQQRKPSLAAGLMIVAGLGDWAVNRLLHCIRYQATSLDADEAVGPMQIVADAIEHIAVISHAAADGRIDHLEEPQTTEAADRLIATVTPLSSARKRG